MNSGETRHNDRLRDAIAQSGLTSVDVASQLGVDPRTVDRWVDDQSRIPRLESRVALAELLDSPAAILWPNSSSGPHVSNELLAMYPRRISMPIGHVSTLLSAAIEQIDILVLAGVWLWDSVPDFGESLAGKAKSGVGVRVCIGHDVGVTAGRRGEEEGIDDLLASRCRLSASYAKRHLGTDPNLLRLHDTTLYASLLRFDDSVLINWHLYGAPAAESPIFHVQRRDGRGLADAAIASFDRVWATAQPLSR